MNTTLALIRQRRRLLLIQVAEQRLEMASTLARWRLPLSVADNVINVAKAAARRPVVVVLVSILLWRLSRGRLPRWTGRLMGVWEIYRFWRRQNDLA
jgi:hypothetical protein